MGKYRFRLSDMIPNAWFYKLKDMSRHNKNHHHKITNPPNKNLHPPSSSSLAAPPNNHPSKITKLPHLSDQRKSYYFTRDLTFHPNSPIESPRRSSRRRRSTKRSRLHNRQSEPRLFSSSISAGCSCRATLESVWTKPPPEDSQTDQTSSSDDHGSTLTEYGSDRGLIPDDAFDDMLSSCKCRTRNDVVNINMDDNNRVSGFDHHGLPPIITKKQHHHEPTKIQQQTSAEFSERNEYGSLSVKVVKENFSSPVRRFSGNSSLSPGVKLRTNTPKIANRRIQGRKSVSSSGSSRRSVSESFAVVKSSKDPGRDFKESMVEMIVENNIRASKDLEELLACYLSLNSDEYHDLIINVFKQIWFDFIRCWMLIRARISRMLNRHIMPPQCWSRQVGRPGIRSVVLSGVGIGMF